MPLISTKEARKRLGALYSDLPDEVVEDLIQLLGKMVRETISELSSKNNLY